MIIVTLLAIGLQISCVSGQFSFGNGDDTNSGSFFPGFETKPKASSGDKHSSGSGSPFAEMIPFSESGFKFGLFMNFPDFLQGANLGIFMWNAMNVFMNKGLFFTTTEEMDKTPYTMQPKNATKPKKPLNSSINNDGVDFDHLISIYEVVMTDSPHRAHPLYLKRDAAGLDAYAVIGDILSVVVSTVLDVASKGEGSPLIIAFWWIIQRILVHQIRLLIGYPYGDGVMTIGPCMSNIDAVKLALAAKLPVFAVKGFLGMVNMPGFGNTVYRANETTIGCPVIFISEGNIDVLKIFGIFSGIPAQFQVKVKMDKNGRMDPADLEKKILEVKDGKRMPFMVIASVGTHRLGAVDPIAKIATISEKYDLWLHIDGNFGGPALFSPAIKEKWKGVERSNSFAFSFSTLLGVPESASFLITRNDGIFKSMFNAEKMFTMVASHILPQFMQTPKMTDAGKSWFMWFIKGYRGLRQHVEYSYNLTRMVRDKMKSRPNFQLLTTEIDTPVVPFRVIPSNMDPKDEEEPEYIAELDKFTQNLKMKLIFEGFVYISIMRRLPGEPKHFMYPLTNSFVTETDIDYVLEKIDCLAKKLEGKPGGKCSDYLSKKLRTPSPLATKQGEYVPYVNALMPDLHLPFFKGMFEMFLKMTFFRNPKNSSSTALDLGLAEVGLKQKDVMVYVQDFILFMSKFFPFKPENFKMMDKCDIVGMLAEFLTTLMCPTMQNKEASPTFVHVSDELKSFIRKKVGYPNGEGAGKVGTPDGTMATQYTIAIAKFHKEMNETKDRDETSPEKAKVMYISTEAHYSWKRTASSMGIGLRNCKYIPVDSATGQMDPPSLRKAIQTTLTGDKTPFLVVATLGTDVLGSIDPFNDIADICKEFGIWLHVDGRYGGPVILSEKQRKKVKGIERSDSFGFSPEKFYRGPGLDFTVLVTRHKNIFNAMFDQYKDIDDDEDAPKPTGPRSSNEFKFWMFLKSEGAVKTAQRVDKILQNTQDGVKSMKDPKNKGAFQLILEHFELTSICFLYIPKSMRGKDADPETLDAVQIELDIVLKKNKITSVYYTNSTVYQDGLYGFMKTDVVLENYDDLAAVISKVDKFGQEIDVEKAKKLYLERKQHSSSISETNEWSTTETNTTITTTTITETTYTTVYEKSKSSSSGGSSSSSSSSSSGGESSSSSGGSSTSKNKTLSKPLDADD